MKQYDVIFIGSGHACWHGALLLKLAGKLLWSKSNLLGEPAQIMAATPRFFWTLLLN